MKTVNGSGYAGQLLADETGSAPAQFLLLGVPLLAVAFVCHSLVLASYEKDVVLDAAVEAALAISLADQAQHPAQLIAAANQKAQDVVGAALRGMKAEVSVIRLDVHGSLANQVQVRLPKQNLLLPQISASSAAYLEMQ